MSQSDSVRVTVGAHKYDCFKLDPRTMNVITHKIINTLGESAGELVLAFLSGKEGASADDVRKGAAAVAANPKEISSFIENNLNVEHLASGLSKILTNLSADDAQWLMDELASKTTIEGGGQLSATWDAHWLGRPFDMYRWTFAALRSQYGFLG